MLDFPGPWTGSSSPPANWSTLPPRDAQHHLADWPILLVLRDARHHRLVNLFPSGPRSPPPPPNPPRLPSQLARPPPLVGAPPKESPCGTTVQPAGCLAWADSPARGPRPPPRGQAQCTAGPETPSCRRGAPALTLRACQHPAVPIAHPPPRARASSSLPGPSSPVLPLYILSNPICEQNGKSGVKVYKKVSKNALYYGPGPSFWTAQFSADLEEEKRTKLSTT